MCLGSAFFPQYFEAVKILKGIWFGWNKYQLVSYSCFATVRIMVALYFGVFYIIFKRRSINLFYLMMHVHQATLWTSEFS